MMAKKASTSRRRRRCRRDGRQENMCTVCGRPAAVLAGRRPRRGPMPPAMMADRSAPGRAVVGGESDYAFYGNDPAPIGMVQPRLAAAGAMSRPGGPRDRSVMPTSSPSDPLLPKAASSPHVLSHLFGLSAIGRDAARRERRKEEKHARIAYGGQRRCRTARVGRLRSSLAASMGNHGPSMRGPMSERETIAPGSLPIGHGLGPSACPLGRCHPIRVGPAPRPPAVRAEGVRGVSLQNGRRRADGLSKAGSRPRRPTGVAGAAPGKGRKGGGRSEPAAAPPPPGELGPRPRSMAWPPLRTAEARPPLARKIPKHSRREPSNDN